MKTRAPILDPDGNPPETGGSLPEGGIPMRFNTVRFYFFKCVRCAGDWEAGAILGPLQIRVARSQFAIWWKHEALVNRLYGFHNYQELAR